MYKFGYMYCFVRHSVQDKWHHPRYTSSGIVNNKWVFVLVLFQLSVSTLQSSDVRERQRRRRAMINYTTYIIQQVKQRFSFKICYLNSAKIEYRSPVAYQTEVEQLRPCIKQADRHTQVNHVDVHIDTIRGTRDLFRYCIYIRPLTIFSRRIPNNMQIDI